MATKARALYDYSPAERDELALVAGDLVAVLEVKEDGWSQGHIEHSPDRIGLFPSNYVRESQNTPPSHLPSSFHASSPLRQGSRGTQQKQRVPEVEATTNVNDDENEQRHEREQTNRTTDSLSLQYARALFDYTPQEPDELALKAGDFLCVLEKDRLSIREDEGSEEEEGWGRGYLESNPNQRGVFPLNYIQIVKSATEQPPTTLSLSSEMQQTVEALKKEKYDIITSSSPSRKNVKRLGKDSNDDSNDGDDDVSLIVKPKTNDMKSKKQHHGKEEDAIEMIAPVVALSETKSAPVSCCSSFTTTSASLPDASGYYDAYGNYVLPSGAYYAPDGTYYDTATSEANAKDHDDTNTGGLPVEASSSSLEPEPTTTACADEGMKKMWPSSENGNGDNVAASSSSTSGYYDCYGNYVLPSGAYYAPDGTYYDAASNEATAEDNDDQEATATTMPVSSPKHDEAAMGTQRPNKGAAYPESTAKASTPTSKMVADTSSVKQLKRQFDLAKEASARAEEARLKAEIEMETEVAARRKIERAAALKVQIQLEEEAKAKALQKNIHAQLQHTVQTRAAATVIQLEFRNYRLRRLWGGMALAIHQRRIAAVRMQRFIRRCRCRVFFKKKLMQYQRALKERHSMMAVRIQRMCRRYRMLRLVDAAIKSKKTSVVVVVPKAVKQQSKPARTKYRSKVHELAAARIQRAYQHYKLWARLRALLDSRGKQAAQHPSQKELIAYAYQRRELSQDEAAVRIQRAARGKKKKKRKDQKKNLRHPLLLSPPAKVTPLTSQHVSGYPDPADEDALRMLQHKVIQQAQSVVFATEVTQVAQLATLIANSVNLELSRRMQSHDMYLKELTNSMHQLQHVMEKHNHALQNMYSLKDIQQHQYHHHTASYDKKSTKMQRDKGGETTHIYDDAMERPSRFPVLKPTKLTQGQGLYYKKSKLPVLRKFKSNMDGQLTKQEPIKGSYHYRLQLPNKDPRLRYY